VSEPLPVLLSRALVAFTVEVDDRVEELFAHRTATGPAVGGDGPWLISLAMWQNYLRLVEPGGTPLAQLRGAGAITNVNGLRRWGWIRTSDDERAHLRQAVSGIRAVEAQAIAEVEGRWADRLGARRMSSLRRSLDAVRKAIGGALPRYLPVVRHSLFAAEALAGVPDGDLVRSPLAKRAPDLATGLAQVLLAFTLAAEDGAGVAMPVSANLLSVLDGDAVPVRDLPALTGLAKEGVAFAQNVLTRSERAALGPAVGGRGQVIRLTEPGLKTKRSVGRRVAELEADWARQHGTALARVRTELAELDGDGVAGASPLLDAIVHPSGGWRVARRPRLVLPRHPLVLHRGGYPDGA
jgi:hypothetical protein